MLAGVDEDGIDAGMALHFADERRDFGEVGARSDDVEDFDLLTHGVSKSDGGEKYSIRVLRFRLSQYAVRAKKALVPCKGVRQRQEPA
jgi:hypothetical protein